MKLYIKSIFGMVMLIFSVGMACAEDEEFNPVNPPDPMGVHSLRVSYQTLREGETEPYLPGIASVSGRGNYRVGARVYINTSLSGDYSGDYKFSHWESDGVSISTSRGFYYTMPDNDVNIVAVYKFVPFDPVSPTDPGADYKRRVYLTAVPEEACSFSINSGNKYMQGSSISITTYANQGFEFNGWWCNGEKLSDEKTLRYTVPQKESTLEARYIFNPDSPADPIGSNQPSCYMYLLSKKINVGLDSPFDITYYISNNIMPTSFSFDLKIPQGLQINTEKGISGFNFTDRVEKDVYDISILPVGDTYHLQANLTDQYKQSEQAHHWIQPGESAFFNLSLLSGSEVANYEITLSNTRFETAEGDIFAPKDITLLVNVANSTAIEVIETENTAAQYYNLQGQPVPSNTRGILIRRSGPHATKILK